MSGTDSERLYALLPAFYRAKDAAEGEPLRALLLLIEEQLRLVEADISGLYGNWFVETCDPWVLPYIADLLGVESVRASAAGGRDQRAYVANTVAYRRRKGTPAALEQMARDLTSWPTRVVEMWSQLATTQHLNNLRPRHVRTPDLRDTASVNQLGTAFSAAALTLDVRGGRAGRPSCGPGEISLFTWRLESYPRIQQRTFPESMSNEVRQRFAPMDADLPLANRPRPEPDISHLAAEVHLPVPLRRRPLFDEIEAYRAALAQGQEATLVYFDPQRPVIEIFPGGSNNPLPLENIAITDLSDWAPTNWTRSYPALGTTDPMHFQISVAVDPELGRLLFAPGSPGMDTHCSFSTLFGGDLGAGPYDRQPAMDALLDGRPVWQIGVSRHAPPQTGVIATTLQEAILAWNLAAQPGSLGIIAVMDSSEYDEDLSEVGDRIRLPAESRLIIIAADWPELLQADGTLARQPGTVVASGFTPRVKSWLGILGEASDADTPGELIIDGLLVDGKIVVHPGTLGLLRLQHMTQLPTGAESSGVELLDTGGSGPFNEQLTVSVYRSIIGGIAVSPQARPAAIEILESVVDSSGTPPRPLAVDALETPVTVLSSTLLGEVEVGELTAADTLFCDAVRVTRKQTGCVRYSYVRGESSTPRRYRCQPDLAVAAARSAGALSEEEEADLRLRHTPAFISRRFPNPAYLQLSRQAAPGLTRGAESGSEMGVWCHLERPLREADLRASLEEHLRFGLHAEPIWTT